MKKITVIIFCLMALSAQAQNTFPATGNVGIGTLTPAFSLDVNGVTAFTNRLYKKKESSTTNPILISAQSEWAAGEVPIITLGYNQGTTGGTDMDTKIRSYARRPDESYNCIIIGRTRVDISGTTFIDGNLGIGTANPTQKLSVNGTIQAKEIIVNTGWSDFVFDNNYKLRSLTEVEQFVKTNKHLPEIPSQKEVEKNGVQLGDISSKLLMKIEELTLYMIEMKKENAAMSNRMELLEKENASLKTSIINNKK